MQTMATKRVTMQDIADACGFSRNTISKAFNARGGIPEATRRMILAKADELGYRQQIRESSSAQAKQKQPTVKSVALFTQQKPMHYHYGTSFITAFANRLSRAGYSLVMYEVTQSEIRNQALPSNFAIDQTVGILGIELFDRGYTQMMCDLGLPVIFADTYARPDLTTMKADLISMENVNSAISLTEQLIEAGAKKIGFVGDINHCNSFHDRWSGYCKALGRAGLEQSREFCILAEDSAPYTNVAWLLEQLEKMPVLPDAFVCANDFLAIHLLNALKKKGLSVPEDIMLTGFDGTTQASLSDPPLTTAYIPSVDIGYFAAGMLLERIDKPDLPYRRTYIQTTPIFNKSVRKKA